MNPALAELQFCDVLLADLKAKTGSKTKTTSTRRSSYRYVLVGIFPTRYKFAIACNQSLCLKKKQRQYTA